MVAIRSDARCVVALPPLDEECVAFAYLNEVTMSIQTQPVFEGFNTGTQTSCWVMTSVKP